MQSAFDQVVYNGKKSPRDGSFDHIAKCGPDGGKPRWMLEPSVAIEFQHGYSWTCKATRDLMPYRARDGDRIGNMYLKSFTMGHALCSVSVTCSLYMRQRWIELSVRGQKAEQLRPCTQSECTRHRAGLYSSLLKGQDDVCGQKDVIETSRSLSEIGCEIAVPTDAPISRNA